MRLKTLSARVRDGVRIALGSLALVQLSIGTSLAAVAAPDSRTNRTASPIKHVIVIIGENRSFDHVFATYVPKHGESVWNLLSEGIVKADGSPGPNFARGAQHAAADPGGDAFLLSPPKA